LGRSQEVSLRGSSNTFSALSVSLDNSIEANGGSSGGVSHSQRRSAWASRATAAGVGGFSLLAVLVYVADEYPTLKTRAGTLQASVVRLYGVVVILSGWVRRGCARLSRVHSLHPFCGPGSGVCQHLRGHLLCVRPTFYYNLLGFTTNSEYNS
jgi:hypothetical protein